MGRSAKTSGTPRKSFGKRRTPFAVLGFLAAGPKSGYDIKRAIGNSTGHFWNESFGQIYPILKELEASGLAAEADAVSGGRQTRRYRITPTGLEALRGWIEKPVEDVVVRNELLLKLFFGRQSEPEVLLNHLREYRGRIRRQLKVFLTYRKEYGSIESNPRLIYLIAPLEFGIQAHESALAWSESTMRSLERVSGKQSRAAVRGMANSGGG